MRIHFLEHVPFERPAYFLEWARRGGHAVDSTPFYVPDRARQRPEIESIDLLVVMGGPMSVWDEDRFPWLAAEKAFLRRAIDGGTRVLGVCLGAQLIAAAMGARVGPNTEPEIGWFPIERSAAAGDSALLADLPARVSVFHWHGDTFERPDGALHIASSEACRNQAFELAGRVVGLQFHLEATPLSVARLISHCGREIIPAPWVQNPDGAAFPVAPSAYETIHALLDRLLDRMTRSGA